MAGILSGILNNTILQMVVYNLIGQLVGAAVAPEVEMVAAEVWTRNPTMPLTPADVAAAVVRGEMTEAQAAAEAAKSGYNAERTHTLIRLNGDAPAPGDLVVALRRGIIDHPRFVQGIQQGRMRNEWTDVIEQLGVQQPPPTAMLAALLEGQISEAEAKRRYAALGGDPAYFQILFDTEGSAPSPLEAAEMARRGVIGWDGTGAGVVSYEQAFLEGPWRNKWSKPYRALAEYLPPPRTITAMIKEGAMTPAEGGKLLAEQGLNPTMVAAYLQAASSQKTAATKDLAQTQITALYHDRIIGVFDATSMLISLGYDAAEAGFILSIEDLRKVQQYLAIAVGRIHTLYVGHKIDRTAAINALGQLKVDATEITELTGIWDWERAANVRVLTPAEIAGAMHWKIIDQPAAQLQLEQLGYTPHDAWVYLSVHEKAPLGVAPAPGAIGPPPGP